MSSRRNTIFADTSERGARGSILQLAGVNRRKSDMLVVLDRSDGVYTAGETVRGHVSIALTQEIRVIDLVLRFYGSGRVSWDEQRTYTKGSAPSVCLKNTETYLDFSMSLFKTDVTSVGHRVTSCHGATQRVSNAGAESADEGVVFTADNHSIPFEYQLPRDLPSSYSGRWGQVKYVIKAKLQRPWKFDIDRETELTVKSFVDLNDEPELARPIGTLNDFNAGLMCFRSGPITVELRTPRRGYIPGEVVSVSAEIDNSSRYKLFHCHLTLNQHVLFRAGRKLRKTCVVVTSLDKDDVLPGARALWSNESLKVPVVAPTSNKLHRNIEIKYTLALIAQYSSWADQICLPLALTIGTVALRKQTINTYLTMLGYGLTSQSSPVVRLRNVMIKSNEAATTTATTTAGSRVSSTPRASLTASKSLPLRRTSNSSIRQLQQPQQTPVTSSHLPRPDSCTTMTSLQNDVTTSGACKNRLAKSSSSESTKGRTRQDDHVKPKKKLSDVLDINIDDDENNVDNGPS